MQVIGKRKDTSCEHPQIYLRFFDNYTLKFEEWYHGIKIRGDITRYVLWLAHQLWIRVAPLSVEFHARIYTSCDRPCPNFKKFDLAQT
jgi:hypothetical protein